MSVGIGISAHKVVLGFNWVALLVVHVGFQGSGHIQLPSAWHVTVYPGLSYTAGDLETRRFGDSYQPVRLLARASGDRYTNPGKATRRTVKLEHQSNCIL